MSFYFTIAGPPRTKKTHNRIVRVGRFVKILPSEQYEHWFADAMKQAPLIRRHLEDLHALSLPLTGKIHIAAKFYRDAARGDLLGYAQGLADYLQEPRMSRDGKVSRDGAGIILNDSQIVSWDGTRLLVDAGNPRIEVEVDVAHETPWLWASSECEGA